MIDYIIFLGSVFLSSISQILLKISANGSYQNRWKEYFNVRVIIAYGIFFLSSFMTILAYRGVPLSLGPILESSGYFWVTILGYVILKETVSKKKAVGLLVILLGILISTIE